MLLCHSLETRQRQMEMRGQEAPLIVTPIPGQDRRDLIQALSQGCFTHFLAVLEEQMIAHPVIILILILPAVPPIVMDVVFQEAGKKDLIESPWYLRLSFFLPDILHTWPLDNVFFVLLYLIWSCNFRFSYHILQILTCKTETIQNNCKIHARYRYLSTIESILLASYSTTRS